MRATLPISTEISPSDTRTEAPVGPSLQGSARRGALIHRLFARVLLGGLALQLFFAGLGVFGITTFLPHVILGTGIVLTSFALPIVAWRGHLGSSLLRPSWLLAGLMMLQGLLIDVGRILPIVSALHPVNAMLLVLVTYNLASRGVEHSGHMTM